jgi:membrane protease YdiL (CAAX protease family)
MQQPSDEAPPESQSASDATAQPPLTAAAAQPADAAGLPTGAVDLAQTGPRFCGRCGARWDATWITCQVCAAGAATTAAAEPRSGAGSVKSALALYFVLLGTSLLGAAMIAAGSRREDTAILAAIDILDSMLVLIWAAARWQDVLPGLRRSRPGWCLAAAGMAIPTFLLASAVLIVLVRLLGAAHLNYSEPIGANGHGLGLIVLLICVQPAVIEELAFRGIILSALRDALSDGEAIVVSAMMFMIIHCSVISLPQLLTLGLVLAWLRVRTGSLWPGIVLHFSHNFLVIGSEMLGVLQP